MRASTDRERKRNPGRGARDVSAARGVRDRAAGTRIRIVPLAFVLSLAASQAWALELHIDASAPGPQISRYVYGQFMEHLGRGGIREAKGSATDFGEDEWISTLARTLRIEGYIERREAILARNDPDGRIGLYVDEWGTWCDPEPGGAASPLYQQNTLRDAVVAALNFHVFHRHAEHVRMAASASRCRPNRSS